MAIEQTDDVADKDHVIRLKEERDSNWTLSWDCFQAQE